MAKQTLKTGGELRGSERVSTSGSTSGTRRVNLITNRWQVMNEERTGKCLWQVEHFRASLLVDPFLYSYEMLVQRWPLFPCYFFRWPRVLYNIEKIV